MIKQFNVDDDDVEPTINWQFAAGQTHIAVPHLDVLVPTTGNWSAYIVPPGHWPIQGKVGRAPAALNFAADTSWDTDWSQLERAWAVHQNVLSKSVKGFGFCEGSKFDHSHWIAI